MAISDLDPFEALGLPAPLAATLRDAAGPPKALGAGDQLVSQGDPPIGLIFVRGGVIKACRSLDNGLVQTLALFTPGDLLGGQALALGREPSSLAAVSASRYALVPLARLRPLVAESPALLEVLWRALAREAAILQEWLVGVGRRPALSQLAHLLCEMAVRLRVAGRESGDVYAFPLTQTELADAAGLSPVHVNRILQTLRADGLIVLTRGHLRIVDGRRLAQLADFDPAYLEPPARPREGPGALFLGPPDGHPADAPRIRAAGFEG